MELIRQLRPAIVALVLFSVLTGVVYPLVITGIAQVAFPDQANGSLVRDDAGNVVGSELIGQPFAAAGYFHPRPSAAGDGYDASISSGSNLGPTSADLLAAVEERAAAYRTENNLPADALVPVDAVTASASGLDPHISMANALLQSARVATERGLSEEQVRELIDANTDGRSLGVLGEPGVNVLMLNLALDEAAPLD
ncbi:MAG TPA: K(+)-transporting ATPase subunit C [Candidatus Limnocylindria bacterium]